MLRLALPQEWSDGLLNGVETKQAYIVMYDLQIQVKVRIGDMLLKLYLYN